MTYPYQPPPGYGAPAYGYSYDGPPGRVRPTGVSILLFFVTFGIYGYVYNYQVHDEMKRHSGRGIGGGIALLLSFLAGVAMPFLTPHEVGNLYERKGQRPPVRALTGLWSLVPMVVGYVLFFAVFLATATVSSDSGAGQGDSLSGGAVAGLLLSFVLLLGGFLVGGLVWFVKTNGALNAYWETLSRGGFTTADAPPAVPSPPATP